MRFNTAYKRIVMQESQTGSLVGESLVFQELLRLVREAAQGRSTVLITGETGTGKGLVARTIHEESCERDQPFQVIDCTTLPEGMIESELFGHVRGSFTGAIADKPGLIELANRGTVFLDEIGDMPASLQAKLLHVLEENEVRRVGGTRVRRVETRFIAATNLDIEEKVRVGAFRKDLYYRLAVLNIHVPPLKERKEDIPAIARFICTRFGREMGKPNCQLDDSALSELAGYAWPGNVRELRNVIERAVMLTTGGRISKSDVKSLLPSKENGTAKAKRIDTSLPYAEAKQKLLAEFNAVYLQEKLSLHGGHITKAAAESGMHPNYFSLLMKRFLSRDKAG